LSTVSKREGGAEREGGGERHPENMYVLDNERRREAPPGTKPRINEQWGQETRKSAGNDGIGGRELREIKRLYFSRAKGGTLTWWDVPQSFLKIRGKHPGLAEGQEASGCNGPKTLRGRTVGRSH